jgi:hypothetical protein
MAGGRWPPARHPGKRTPPPGSLVSDPCASNDANPIPMAPDDPPGALLPAVSSFGGFERRPRCPLPGPRWPASNQSF